MIRGNPAGSRAWLQHAKPETAIKILRRLIAECECLYPWAALLESWRADLRRLESRG